MVRRRGRPRRSWAWLRQRKYAEKWSHKSIPIRFKLLQPPMSASIETALIQLDYLEVQVFAKLEQLGVEESEWVYYMAFAKRVWETFMGFWYDTAIVEVYTLIEEFVMRGLVEDTLKAVADVVLEKCTMYRPLGNAETPLPAPPLPPFIPPPPPPPPPIDQTFNFDDWTSQGWKRGQTCMADPPPIPNCCESPQNVDVASDGGVVAHSPPCSLRVCMSLGIVTVWGAVKLWDFRGYNTIVITDWLFKLTYPGFALPHLKCFNYDTGVLEYYHQIAFLPPGVWTQYVNDISATCANKRICIGFSVGLGTDDLYLDDLRIQASA